MKGECGVCFALHLLCFALLWHCFALRLLCKLPGSPGEEKNAGGLIATQSKNSCAPFAPPGRMKGAMFIQLVNRLRRALGWNLGV